jgi:superoxide dismutase, Cu-Zn family
MITFMPKWWSLVDTVMNEWGWSMRSSLAVTLIAWSVGLLACSGGGERRSAERSGDQAVTPDTPAAAAVDSGVALAMRDAKGKELGTLRLTDAGQGISVAGRLTGLPPEEHGIHLHTTGKCEPPKFTSAGDHWNPTNRQHGTMNPQGPHLGDLPNFTVTQDGSATIEAATTGGSLRGSNALLDSDGAAVVVHARRDDYKSQPAGNAGDRIACGVVGSGKR